jgi:hypothetical protein
MNSWYPHGRDARASTPETLLPQERIVFALLANGGK